MGVLRSCMRDEAARWFDAELTGKNWELSSIRLVAAANAEAGTTRRAFRALVVPEGAGGPNAGTYVPGSAAHIGKFFGEQICADFQKLYLRRSYTLAQNIRGKIQ
jgi:hypothetical protein